MTKKQKVNQRLLAPGLPARITKLVESESDRGAILILGAYLEELLGDLIQASCISDAAAADLLELRRPAGDFDSRIAVCGAFGLLHPTEVAALQAVRRIRNSAAHFDKKGRGFDVLFDSDSTIDLVKNLAEAVNLVVESREREPVKQLFIVSTRLLATKIMLRAAVAERPAVPPTVKEFANAARERFRNTPQGKQLEEMEEAVRNGDMEKISAFWKDLGVKLQARVDACQKEDNDS
jgi:hypothetical protein